LWSNDGIPHGQYKVLTKPSSEPLGTVVESLSGYSTLWPFYKDQTWEFNQKI